LLKYPFRGIGALCVESQLFHPNEEKKRRVPKKKVGETNSGEVTLQKWSTRIVTKLGEKKREKALYRESPTSKREKEKV